MGGGGVGERLKKTKHYTATTWCCPTDFCVLEVVLILFPALDKVLLLLSDPHASLCPAPQLRRAERYFFIQSDVVSAAFTWCGEDLTSGFSEAKELSEVR